MHIPLFRFDIQAFQKIKIVEIVDESNDECKVHELETSDILSITTMKRKVRMFFVFFLLEEDVKSAWCFKSSFSCLLFVRSTEHL